MNFLDVKSETAARDFLADSLQSGENRNFRGLSSIVLKYWYQLCSQLIDSLV